MLNNHCTHYRWVSHHAVQIPPIIQSEYVYTVIHDYLQWWIISFLFFVARGLEELHDWGMILTPTLIQRIVNTLYMARKVLPCLEWGGDWSRLTNLIQRCKVFSILWIIEQPIKWNVINLLHYAFCIERRASIGAGMEIYQKWKEVVLVTALGMEQTCWYGYKLHYSINLWLCRHRSYSHKQHWPGS